MKEKGLPVYWADKLYEHFGTSDPAGLKHLRKDDLDNFEEFKHAKPGEKRALDSIFSANEPTKDEIAAEAQKKIDDERNKSKEIAD